MNFKERNGRTGPTTCSDIRSDISRAKKGELIERDEVGSGGEEFLSAAEHNLTSTNISTIFMEHKDC